MPGKLGTKGSRRGCAAFLERTESSMVEKKAGEDQQQKSGDGIRNGGVAEEEEDAPFKHSCCGGRSR